MAGSFGALGADLSCALINPAGYGRYSSSQFNMGLNYNNIRNTGTFQGMTAEASRNPVRPSSFGLIIVNDVSDNNKGFLYNQFGLSYNRVDNFTNTMQYQGKLYNSLLDGFSSSAYGYSPEELSTYFPFTTSLAWETYAIDQDGQGGYVPRLTAADTMMHRRNIESKGGISEYSFSFSTNYMNKLYFGANWGIRTVRYEETYSHNEKLDNGALSLDSFNYTYSLDARGSGSNLKLGVIYLPIESLRFGLSYHTPTFFEIREKWNATMTAYHGDTVRNPAENPQPGDYKYRLRTPSKFVGSVAYVFGTRGSINVDLEYMDYKWAHLKSTKDRSYYPEENNYRYQNEEADAVLRPVLNIRVGGELVFQSQYIIRAGYAFYPQPYQAAAANGNRGSSVYSAGAGIKFKRSTIDLAYKIQSKYFDYYAFAESRASFKSVAQGIVLSYSVSF